MNRLLLIDGNNLLFQMFYGMPSPIYNKKGRPIHGTIGFISAVIKMIKTYSVTNAAVVFDCDGSEERSEEFPEYKRNRINNWEDMPPQEVPFSQEEDIRRALDYMKIKYIYSSGCEADDLIAGVGREAEKKGWEVIISSFDSDFFQLISERISVLRFRGKASVMWNEKRFFSSFGFTPRSYPLYKAITGDSADNIPGLSGFGKKRTSLFVSEYEREKAFPSPLLSERLNATLLKGREVIERNLRLIRLKEIEQVGLSLEETEFDRERIEEGNSRVLSLSGVFDT